MSEVREREERQVEREQEMVREIERLEGEGYRRELEIMRIKE